MNKDKTDIFYGILISSISILNLIKKSKILINRRTYLFYLGTISFDHSFQSGTPIEILGAFSTTTVHRLDFSFSHAVSHTHQRIDIYAGR